MRFNSKKCYLLSSKTKSSFFYTIGNTILKNVQENPYLGITFSNDMKWKTHISNITKRANSTLGFLRRNLRYCPQNCRKTAYQALIRSKLEYGSVVWDPYQQGDIDKLERVQRSAARFITRDYKSRQEGCVTAMLDDLNLPTLQERRRHQRLTFLYKVVEGHVPAINIDHYLHRLRPKRTIRAKKFEDYVHDNIVLKSVNNNSKCYQPLHTNSDKFKYSFFPRTILDWNLLSESTVNSTSIECFKAAISAKVGHLPSSY
jgi:hypothetical protein